MHRRLQHLNLSRTQSFTLIRTHSRQDHQVQRKPKALRTDQTAGVSARPYARDIRKYKKSYHSIVEKTESKSYHHTAETTGYLIVHSKFG